MKATLQNYRIPAEVCSRLASEIINKDTAVVPSIAKQD
jgi:hypothetical protein